MGGIRAFWWGDERFLRHFVKTLEIAVSNRKVADSTARRLAWRVLIETPTMRCTFYNPRAARRLAWRVLIETG